LFLAGHRIHVDIVTAAATEQDAAMLFKLFNEIASFHRTILFV
jgi:hypothetical protein